MSKDTIKQRIKEGYAKIARTSGSCCPGSTCCGSNSAKAMRKTVGYTEKELNAISGVFLLPKINPFVAK